MSMKESSSPTVRLSLRRELSRTLTAKPRPVASDAGGYRRGIGDCPAAPAYAGVETTGRKAELERARGVVADLEEKG